MTNKGKQEFRNGPRDSRAYLELKYLFDISQSLHHYLSIEDLIPHIIGQVTEVMSAEAVSVILHDEAEDELVFCWSSDTPERQDKLQEIRFPADHGIAGSVFRSGKAEIISSVETDSRHFGQVDTDTGFKTKSMIAVPLKTKIGTIGVLEVLNKKKGLFDDKDLSFLKTLAPIIAMALDNARMYSQLDRAYQELKIVDISKDELIKRTRNKVDELQREVERHYRFDQIIGNSEAMSEVFRLCERVIDSEITVLIEGETGTGKEIIARAILTRFWQANFSVTGRELIREPLGIKRDFLRLLTAAQCSWMKWVRLPRQCKPVFCEFCKKVKSNHWDLKEIKRWM